MEPGPGKFEGNEDGRLANVLHDTEPDDQVGSVDELGWYGLIIQRNHAYIVHEDNYGFFDYTRFDDINDAENIWEGILNEYAVFYDSLGD